MELVCAARPYLNDAPWTLTAIDARSHHLYNRSTVVGVPVPAAELDPAPVFLIRDAATDAGVHSPEQAIAQTGPQSDVISTGLVSLQTAHSLLGLFHVHYGRWVRFPEDIPTDRLLLQVRKSPLLLCSIFLISVRHTSQNLADRLAPKLFEESKRLITTSLLEVPQTVEFFQAVLILSLWSTTIGQVPLSIDSWLLTGYAIQQALASPHFMDVIRPGSSQHSSDSLDDWCLWNHLCVAHLQYCVGTRRHSLLTQAQVDQCVDFVKSNEVNNYEARMGAEVQLYWIIYNKCGIAQVDLAGTKLALQAWQQDWMVLFHEPRSQFLQMGFHFAHLLAHCQSLKSPKSVMHSSVLKEMIKHSKIIINLAIDTTDDRTRHLTDHIYHILSFSALTLCRIVHTYESKLRATNYDTTELDNIVFKLINWFKTIGLPCHAAHILGDIVHAQFQKLRPDFQPSTPLVSGALSENPDEYFSPAKFFDETRPPIHSLAPLAALSRRWQPLIEEASFRQLKLNSESVLYAIDNNILTPRRLSYLRRLDYSFSPPDEEHPPTTRAEIDTGFVPLFRLLAQIPLQDEPLVDFNVTMPWAPSGPSYLSKLEDHVEDNFDVLKASLPEVPMIRSFYFCRGFDRFFYSPRSFCLIVGTMSRLGSLTLRLMSQRGPENVLKERNELARSLNGLPSSIHQFDLDYYVNPRLLLDAMSLAPTEEDILSRELCKFSQREGLKDFSFTGSIEPTILWPSESETAEKPHWPSLKAFELTPSDISPSGKRLVVRNVWRSPDSWHPMYPVDDVANEYFAAAARCVSRMPKAEYLSVELKDSWSTTLVFCTGYPNDPDEPILRLSGGGGAKISEETEKEWRKTAEIHNLKFSMEVDEEENQGIDNES
ncbi:hypothetical protein F25303_1712 [Fusarium sp. NRRL 25303]|nr:hypothetical protein F25303_1712 [Fusarium sp. NRRL 25303]